MKGKGRPKMDNILSFTIFTTTSYTASMCKQHFTVVAGQGGACYIVYIQSASLVQRFPT